MKQVSNEDFIKAWEKPDNRNIIRSVISQYSKLLDEDDLSSCAKVALWRCLGYHKDSYGQKFTTSLWTFVQWECRRELRKHKKHSQNVQLSGIDIDIAVVNENTTVSHLKDCMSLLDNNEKQILSEYYIERLTMEEIGKKYGFSKEAARQKINRAVKNLRNLVINEVK